MYKIPDSVKVKFDPIQIEGLSDFFFRVIWCAISIGHIRDQYFSLEVYEFVDELKKRWPMDIGTFIWLVNLSPLNKYGKRSQCAIDVNWWIKIWERLYYKRDIELMRI